ncbi:hypothetical protein ACH5RR_020693 [Cinchona calisaya]|uniref:RRM domain-containing protein n=1 Tax=Cinchona calisaya TaxID=153742 RepID=A0ABD2ZG71_9GENT
MSYSRRSRYSLSRSPYRRYSGSVSRSLSRSRSRSRGRSRSCDSVDAENPGNNLYVTGLSTRVTKRVLEKHFSTEGKVEDVHLVIDPWSRESRGFGFVTMSCVEDADRCIKYLNHSVLEGRVITIEKARRRRGRTPTPGRYRGLKTIHVHRRSTSYCRSRSRSPRYSSARYRSRSRSYSPYYSRRRYSTERSRSRSYTPYYSRCRRSYSAYHRRERSYSRSRSPYSRSPVGRRDRSYSPYYRDYSPDDYYRRRCRYRSISRSISPRYRRYSRSYSCSVSPRRSRSYSRSLSPLPRKSSRRSYSRSISPRPRKSSKRRVSRGSRGSSKCAVSRDSYSRSPSMSASSRSVSRSVTPVSD